MKFGINCTWPSEAIARGFLPKRANIAALRVAKTAPEPMTRMTNDD